MGRVTRCQVRKLHAFVKEKYPRAECLETVVVSRRAVEQLDAVADEAVAQGSWFEVTTACRLERCQIRGEVWFWLELPMERSEQRQWGGTLISYFLHVRTGHKPVVRAALNLIQTDIKTVRWRNETCNVMAVPIAKLKITKIFARTKGMGYTSTQPLAQFITSR